jgi:hypothetical protein
MLNHVLQMGDQGIVRSGRHRGLMHVQRAGEAGADAAEIEIAVVPPDRWLLLHQLHQLRFTAADGGEVDHWAEAPCCVQSIALISGFRMLLLLRADAFALLSAWRTS